MLEINAALTDLHFCQKNVYIYAMFMMTGRDAEQSHCRLHCCIDGVPTNEMPAPTIWLAQGHVSLRGEPSVC